MLSCFRGVRAARRDDRPSFGDTPRAEALERFDRLRIREVRAVDGQTASTFLAKFQSITAGLEPDERIELVVYTAQEHEAFEGRAFRFAGQQDLFLEVVVRWEEGHELHRSSPHQQLPRTGLTRGVLQAPFAFDFVSSMLEHPSNKLKVLRCQSTPKEALQGSSPRWGKARCRRSPFVTPLSLLKACANTWRETCW
ncbi:hypothetical protein BASA81_007869 [Batrachochytrium salamandrivorans]|nr:hypothetical protein BASA81_007869 [Batrachochytrium salamandrivorans]